jgi:hypothetical protein
MKEVIVLACSALAVFVCVKGPRDHVPSDLRDAVSDEFVGLQNINASEIRPVGETPAPKAGVAAAIGKDLASFQRTIDPTSYPYPKGPEATQRELARIRGTVSDAEAAQPAGARQLLDELRALGVSDVDLYHGSHLVLLDGGKRYKDWTQLDARPRISSHYRDVHVQQYEIRYAGIGVFLFGLTGKGDTWCQMEAHGASISDAPLHIGDYIKSKAGGGINVGPRGLSPRNDSHPIVIENVKG